MPKDTNYDHLIKLLIVGDSGIGKTNILLRFCEDNFLNSHLTTIGIDFRTKTVDIDNKRIRLQIWDTAGQQRFKTITQTYFRGAMGILLTYAVNDRQSFQNLPTWLKQIKQASPDVVIVLVGNKSDSKRVVSYQQGKKFAQEIGVKFFQTSAKDDQNIEQCFLTIARQVKEKIGDQKQISVMSFTGSKLQREDELKNQNKKCC